jgi:hypothetical protein
MISTTIDERTKFINFMRRFASDAILTNDHAYGAISRKDSIVNGSDFNLFCFQMYESVLDKIEELQKS